jgi:hypothetical protein
MWTNSERTQIENFISTYVNSGGLGNITCNVCTNQNFSITDYPTGKPRYGLLGVVGPQLYGCVCLKCGSCGHLVEIDAAQSNLEVL